MTTERGGSASTPSLKGDAYYVASLIVLGARELRDDLPDEQRSFLLYVALRLAGGAGASSGHIAIALKLLASLAARTGRSALTISLSAAAIHFDPGEIALRYYLSKHLADIGRTDEAIEAYSSVLKLEPKCLWALVNRGRLLCESGRIDYGVDDLIQAAYNDCQADGFHDFFARQVIREYGFTSYFHLAVDQSMPKSQGQLMLMSLEKAIYEADSWYLASHVINTPDSEKNNAFGNLIARLGMADVLRESPAAHLVGDRHMRRSVVNETYDYQQLSEEDLLEWYRPHIWRTGGPEPDRVRHLQILNNSIRHGEESGGLAASSIAHYMSGAIALSALFSGRLDWPMPVARLTLPVIDGPNGRHPSPDAVAAVAAWVAEQAAIIDDDSDHDALIGRFALAQFRAAASDLLRLRLGERAAPLPIGQPIPMADWDPMSITGFEDYTKIVGPYGEKLAARLWYCAEPIYREWIIASVLRKDLTEYIAASSEARRLNALIATELWSHLAVDVWRGHREKISAAYGLEISEEDIRRLLGECGMLLDYYVHEIVEDTVVRAVVGVHDADLTEQYVNTRAGDLQELLTLELPGQLSSGGISRRVDELLVDGLAPQLMSTERLIIIPFSYLRNMPFHVLPTIQNAVNVGKLTSITYLPSAAFAARSKTQCEKVDRCLFVGFDDSEIIDIDGELDILRQTFRHVTVLRDRYAKITRVLAELDTHDIAHFACHGTISIRSRCGSLRLADGLLESFDLLATRVPHIVVLNTCLAGAAARYEATSDSSFGIQNALLAAGAGHVIGGLWQVNEWSAREFAKKFYEYWRNGISPAAAVVKAQQALRIQTSDPFLWGPHAHFGDWH